MDNLQNENLQSVAIRRAYNKRAKLNRGIFKGLKFCSYGTLAISVLAVVVIIGFILVRGIPNFTLDLFKEYSRSNPSIWPPLVGTLSVLVISLAIAIPIGVATAIYLVEYTSGTSMFVKSVQVALETLAGIPSIVYGLFGYIFFVVVLELGYSLLSGGLIMSIMILPVIVRSTEEALLSVPNSYREGSLALGSSKVRTIFSVVLPVASGGIITSIILAMGRVISESAVLIFTIGMVNAMPSDIMSAGTTLTLAVYYYSQVGSYGVAASFGVVLVVFVLVLNLIAYFVGRYFKKRLGDK